MYTDKIPKQEISMRKYIHNVLTFLVPGPQMSGPNIISYGDSPCMSFWSSLQSNTLIQPPPQSISCSCFTVNWITRGLPLLLKGLNLRDKAQKRASSEVLRPVTQRQYNFFQKYSVISCYKLTFFQIIFVQFQSVISWRIQRIQLFYGLYHDNQIKTIVTCLCMTKLNRQVQ